MAKTAHRRRAKKTTTRRRRGGLKLFGKDFGDVRGKMGEMANKATSGRLSADTFTRDRGMKTGAMAAAASAKQEMSGMANRMMNKEPISPATVVPDAQEATRGGRRRKGRKGRKSRKSRKGRKSRKTRRGRK